MSDLIGFGLPLAAVALAALLALRALVALLFRPRPAAEAVEPPPPRPLFGGWTGAVAALAPMSVRHSEVLRRALLKAGYYQPSASADFRAVRALCTWLPLLIGLETALLWDDRGVVLITAGYGLLAALVGFFVPWLYVVRRGEQRALRVRQALPMALDLLSLCLTAGVNVIAAFAYVGRQLRPTHPVLAAEMLLTCRQAELRSLGHALTRLADRVQTPEVSTAAYTLAQSEELGVNTADALLELSDSMKTKLRQEAEARANRTSFWMLFPTTLCLFLAAAIVLMAPAGLQLLRESETVQKSFRETQAAINEANKPVVLPRALMAPPPGR